MSSILKGIVDEGENVAVIYIDGKAAAKYARKHEAERDANHLRDRFPNKKIEIKQEVRESVVLDENLHKWFKEKWVRFGPDGKIRGACARGDDSEGKPKCLPQKKAQSLGKKGRKYAASKKRREDPNPERKGKAINVATKKKTNEGKCPHCGGELVSEEMMNEKQDACYRKVKSRYKVWPSAYASGALVQCRKKGAANWGNKSKANEGVIVGHDANDPEVAVLGGAGTMSLSRLKKKAHAEALQLADDIANGKYSASSYNMKQLHNTLNTIVAAEEEMKKLYFGEGELGATLGAIGGEILAPEFTPVSGAVGAKIGSDIQDDYFSEDYTGEFAAEKTPAINPYGGLKDKQHRGAISETPTDNPTGASGEGGWRTVKLKSAGTKVDEDTAYAGGMGQGGNAGQSYRKFKPKSAGTFKEEEQLDEKCWDGYKQVGMKKKGDKMVPNCVAKESSIMKGLKR